MQLAAAVGHVKVQGAVVSSGSLACNVLCDEVTAK